MNPDVLKSIAGMAADIAVEKSSSLTFRSVALWTEAGSLHIHAQSPSQLTLRRHVLCDAEIPRCFVDAQRFASVIAACDSDIRLSIGTSGTQLVVESGARSMRAPTAPVEAPLWDPPKAASGTLPLVPWDKLLPVATTGKAVGREILGTIRLSGEHAIATDGHRLHISKIGPTPELTIPVQASQLLLRLPGQSVSCTENWLWTDAWELGFAVPAGAYPPWERVRGKCSGNEWRVDRVLFASALRAAQTLSADRVYLRGKDSTLTIQYEDIFVEELPALQISKPATVLIDTRMLIDAVKACDGDVITLWLNGQLDPVVVVSDGFEATIMPINPSR